MKSRTMTLMAIAYLALSTAPSHAQRELSYPTANYAISFGQEIIRITSVSGGAVRGDVVETSGADGVTGKRLSGMIIVPLSFDSDLSGSLLPWVADSVEKPGSIRRDARVFLPDGRVRVLKDAVVSKVTLPALDAASKARAFVTLELRPLTISYSEGAASTVRSSEASETLREAGFRLDIQGLPTKGISRIAPLTWTLRQPAQTVSRDRVLRTASGASIGDLRVYIPGADALRWEEWLQSSLQGGNEERSGTLTFLPARGDRPLLQVELHGLGIYDLQREPQQANTAGLPQFVAGLYVERIAIRKP